MTPLHVAAEKGESLDIVKYLISKEADIDITDDNGVRLHYGSKEPTEGAVLIVNLFFSVKSFINHQALK